MFIPCFPPGGVFSRKWCEDAMAAGWENPTIKPGSYRVCMVTHKTGLDDTRKAWRWKSEAEAVKRASEEERKRRLEREDAGIPTDFDKVEKLAEQAARERYERTTGKPRPLAAFVPRGSNREKRKVSEDNGMITKQVKILMHRPIKRALTPSDRDAITAEYVRLKEQLPGFTGQWSNENNTFELVGNHVRAAADFTSKNVTVSLTYGALVAAYLTEDNLDKVRKQVNAFLDAANL